MTINKNILAILFFLSARFAAHTQGIERYNTFSYSVNEGLLQSSMNDMAVDKNNFCWITFPNGVQKFDGVSFTNVPVQPGLPDDKMVKLFRSSKGDLLVSHSQGISLYDINADRFIPVFSQRAGLKQSAEFLGEDDGTIFLFDEKATITGLDINSFKVQSVISTGLADTLPAHMWYAKQSDNIINHRIAFMVNKHLYLWDLKAGKMLYHALTDENIFAYFLRLKTDSEVLYYVAEAMSFGIYNFANRTKRNVSIKERTEKTQVFRSVVYPWQGRTLISMVNNLYETDTSLLVIKSELVNYQNEPVGGVGTIARIREDNFGNLLLATTNRGIKKIIRNNYPIRYYGTAKQDDNFVISILPDKENNRILAGTAGNGLLVFDTMQRLIGHIKTLPGQSVGFSIIAIIKDNEGNYLLYPWSNKKVWRLSADLKSMRPISITNEMGDEHGIAYFSRVLFQDKKQSIVQSQNEIYRFDFASNTVTESTALRGNPMSSLLYDSLLISCSNDTLVYLNARTLKKIKSISFGNTGGVRSFAKDAANNIYVGSNKGIFVIDINGKISRRLGKETGLPDECIYAIAIDKDGFLWCSTNKGIVRISKDNSVLQLTKEDGLQENEFNTNIVATSADGEMFFGGVNGVSSFYPAAINSREEKINLLVTQIKINNEKAFTDTAAWMIDRIDLPYNKNSMSFDFIAMANNNPGQYIYQYQMEGVDKGWVQNNGMQTVRYFLPPGKYVFKVYASRFFDKEAKPMKEIRITIHPPFWKTWWFIAGMTLLLLISMTYTVNQYNRRKYQKKLSILESEHKIKLERERISRDLHDSIGAYANAVLYKTDLLQKEEDMTERKELMNDLRFASKDIITSLRETIWALKKEEYTAEDCLLRIRNFIQPFNRYYPHIRFSVQGEPPAGMNLHSTRALNLVRIVQEGVSNAIKHADATEITVTSSMDKAKWRLTVKDNGKGFDYATTHEQQQGNGLGNISQRAAEGELEVRFESQPGKGTMIIILV